MLNALLNFLFIHPGYALTDQGRAVGLDALHDLLQDHLLVQSFDQGEVSLDTVKVRAVGHVEDRLDLFLCTTLSYFLGLMNLEVIHEEAEFSPSKLL